MSERPNPLSHESPDEMSARLRSEAAARKDLDSSDNAEKEKLQFEKVDTIEDLDKKYPGIKATIDTLTNPSTTVGVFEATLEAFNTAQRHEDAARKEATVGGVINVDDAALPDYINEMRVKYFDNGSMGISVSYNTDRLSQLTKMDMDSIGQEKPSEPETPSVDVIASPVSGATENELSVANEGKKDDAGETSEMRYNRLVRNNPMVRWDGSHAEGLSNEDMAFLDEHDKKIMEEERLAKLAKEGGELLSNSTQKAGDWFAKGSYATATDIERDFLEKDGSIPEEWKTKRLRNAVDLAVGFSKGEYLLKSDGKYQTAVNVNDIAKKFGNDYIEGDKFNFEAIKKDLEKYFRRYERVNEQWTPKETLQILVFMDDLERRSEG